MGDRLSRRLSILMHGRLAAPALVMLAAALRLPGLFSHSLWYDELYTVWTARLPFGSIVREAAASGHPPLYYLLGAIWFSLGSGEAWVRLISWAAGVATVGLAYLLGRELFGRRAGLWAAGLTAVSPLLVWYSGDATAYSWLAFLTALTLLMLVRSARRGGAVNWIGYILAAGSVCLSYFMFPLLLLAGWPLYRLIRDPEKSSRKWWLFSQAMLVTGALALPVVARIFLASGWMSIARPGPGAHMVVQGLAQAPINLLAGAWVANDLNYSGAIHGIPLGAIYALTYGGLALAAAALLASGAVRRRLAGRPSVALSIFCLILLAGPVIAEASIDRFPTARYYLWAVAPVAVLAGGLIAAAAPRKASAAVGSVALTAALALTIFQFGYNDNKVGNWRALMGTVAVNRRPGDLLYCFTINECTVAAAFYLPQPYEIGGGTPDLKTAAIYFAPPGMPWSGYHSGFFTGAGGRPESGAGLAKRIKTDAAGHQRVWLISQDDTYGAFPARNDVLTDMSTGWRQEGEWDFPPDDLRLFVRK